MHSQCDVIHINREMEPRSIGTDQKSWDRDANSSNGKRINTQFGNLPNLSLYIALVKWESINVLDVTSQSRREIASGFR